MALAAAAPLAYASIAAAVAGTAVSVYSAEQQSAYQSAVARNNANVASANAAYAIQQGNQQLAAKQEQTAQLIGKERATAGAAGLSLDSGSPLKIQSDTAKLGQLDALTIQNNAARQAWNYKEQAAGFAAQASQDQAAGNLNAFGDLIGGASSVSGKWAGYINNGTFNNSSNASVPYGYSD